MTTQFQVVIDAGDPLTQARFWAATVGYEVEDTTELINRVLDAGLATRDDIQRRAAVRLADDRVRLTPHQERRRTRVSGRRATNALASDRRSAHRFTRRPQPGLRPRPVPPHPAVRHPDRSRRC